jgi:hypothetical protein
MFTPQQVVGEVVPQPEGLEIGEALKGVIQGTLQDRRHGDVEMVRHGGLVSGVPSISNMGDIGSRPSGIVFDREVVFAFKERRRDPHLAHAGAKKGWSAMSFRRARLSLVTRRWRLVKKRLAK